MLDFRIILFLLMLSACRPATESPQSAEPLSKKADSSHLQQRLAEDNLPSDSSDTDYANCFVLLADTGLDYSTLQKRMFFLHKKLNWPIDTLGRYYDQNKGAIILPEEDEDELYAGEYYPRRFPGQSLSIEYLSVYSEKTSEKSLALIAGIYERAPQADSALESLKRQAKQAFLLKARIYTGCMH